MLHHARRPLPVRIDRLSTLSLHAPAAVDFRKSADPFKAKLHGGAHSYGTKNVHFWQMRVPGGEDVTREVVARPASQINGFEELLRFGFFVPPRFAARPHQRNVHAPFAFVRPVNFRPEADILLPTRSSRFGVRSAGVSESVQEVRCLRTGFIAEPGTRWTTRSKTGSPDGARQDSGRGAKRTLSRLPLRELGVATCVVTSPELRVSPAIELLRPRRK